MMPPGNTVTLPATNHAEMVMEQDEMDRLHGEILDDVLRFNQASIRMGVGLLPTMALTKFFKWRETEAEKRRISAGYAKEVLMPEVIREASQRMKDAMRDPRRWAEEEAEKARLMRGVPNPVPLPSRAELWSDFQAAFADNCTPTEWLAAVKLLVLE